MQQEEFDSLLKETRRFEPSEEFRNQANFRDPTVYDRARQDPEGYWAEQARHLDWMAPFTKVLEWDPPHARWFSDGQLNAAYNAVDRHRLGPRKNKAAILWEGEPGDSKVYTYEMLGREVDRAAHMLTRLGVRRGDRVTIYLSMIPELPIAMLACAKIGAIHSVVFGGFSSQSLRDRIMDAQSKILITADGGWRRGRVVPLKANADEAIKGTPVETVLVVKRVGEASGAAFRPDRDKDWAEEMAKSPTTPSPAETMGAEDILYLLYTSGTTGKPKGIVHTIGGYLVGQNLLLGRFPRVPPRPAPEGIPLGPPWGEGGLSRRSPGRIQAGLGTGLPGPGPPFQVYTQSPNL
ncbi:AMP-binding protein [Kyrpidia tusciae]|uniref:AMP-dependent synthetase and ligase n=1 Tax=Kyrpidia tusciae (strain DSM 2912 / NBRC 15312 / T2) TaxID=562970 RepID=D5WUK4_KYRT2|nr:AMP-binding protein [Kyrpidia tusciae]ADG05394.1 AMP-dependent synthetase and ligase [Kyrpidia tusciae DSM 2912]